MSEERELAEAVARIVGSHSAAGKALAELKRREEAGEAVGIWQTGRQWIVGPSPSPTSISKG